MQEKAITILTLVSVSVIIIISGCVSNPIDQGGIQKFSSEAELREYITANQGQGSNYYGVGSGGMARGVAMNADIAPMALGAQSGEEKSTSSDSSASSNDYSKTNIQVEGVDEADIIKSDGKYLYIVSSKSVVILDAYPAENAKILSNISINGTIQDLYINGDKLVIFGYVYEEQAQPSSGAESKSKMIARPYYWNPSKFFIKVFDVSDRSTPIIKRDIKMDGTYFDSRMIGNYVYFIVNQPVEYQNNVIPLPILYSGGITRPMFDYRDIYYFNYPDYSYRFTDVISMNVQNDAQDISSNPFLLGNQQNMYVSQNNIYITGMKQFKSTYFEEKLLKDVLLPLLPSDVAAKITAVQNMDISDEAKMVEIGILTTKYQNSLTPEERDALQQQIEEKQALIQEEMDRERQKTVIHKIGINEGAVTYKSAGEVPGTPLNQFSMDENGDYFRIATTLQGTWTSNGQTPSKNNVYVLDSNLQITGQLEGIAPGESIYSARFMGDRAYLVTFKQVDPLFVIDLKDPYNPKILGKLKIPGYSDYLHPYDSTHIIGIGKEVDESIDADKVHSDNAVYYTAVQGVKLALFDVSDVENPKEISKYVIGDRGTDSEALRDHKAFLFDKSKNLLVIPILLAESKNTTYEGDFTFQGAYVFDLTLENGFSLKGRITHVKDDSLQKSGYYYFSPSTVKRSLYIGSSLYTLSDKMVKINSLSDLSEIKEIELPYEEQIYYGYYDGVTPMMI